MKDGNLTSVTLRQTGDFGCNVTVSLAWYGARDCVHETAMCITPFAKPPIFLA